MKQLILIINSLRQFLFSSMKYSVVRNQIVSIKEFQRILEKLISKGVIKLILPYKIHFRWFKASCDLYKYGKKDTKIQLQTRF